MLTMRDIETALTRTTDATVEPLTATEARAHIRASDPSEDATVIEPLIKAARMYVENTINRALISQTWKLYLTQFPQVIELRRCPVISVTGITYVDSAGATQTLATSVYEVHTADEPGIVCLKYNQSWPDIRGDKNGIVVTFTAGYGTAASSVPETIKHAMKLLVGHWYSNREAVITGTITKDIEFAVDALLWSERWGSYS